MVAEAANTQIAVIRGAATTPLGDVIDAFDPIVEHIPAILVETGRNTQDPSSSTPRTIREVTCTVPGWLDVKNTDRILDERSRDIFMVITVTMPPDIFGPPAGLLLALKRVTAAGP